jgi:hypothetical protein
MNRKIDEIISKLDTIFTRPKMVSTLPYTVNLSNLNPELVSAIGENQAIVQQFSDSINQLVSKVNNQNIYTNAKTQRQISLDDMNKLKEYYESLLEELKKYITENKSIEKSVDKKNTIGKTIYKYWEINQTTNIYKKYYLCYLLANIISLKQFFKIYTDTLKLLEVNDEKITGLINGLMSQQKLIIFLDKVEEGDNTIRNCVSFVKQTDKSNQLENNGFIFSIKILSTKDSARSINDMNCTKGPNQVVIFNEESNYNFKKINFVCKVEDVELVNNFIFDINYYGCKPVGGTTSYALQFILINRQSKLKFLNNYNGFDTFI